MSLHSECCHHVATLEECLLYVAQGMIRRGEMPAQEGLTPQVLLDAAKTGGIAPALRAAITRDAGLMLLATSVAEARYIAHLAQRATIQKPIKKRRHTMLHEDITSVADALEKQKDTIDGGPVWKTLHRAVQNLRALAEQAEALAGSCYVPGLEDAQATVADMDVMPTDLPGGHHVAAH